MHLIEDASVPAHVRNDIHYFYNYERWVDRIRTGTAEERGLFNQFISYPISFDQSILRLDPNPLAPIPIAKIIDTDNYNDGSGRQVTFTNAIGIAEFTNANFFSEDTISNAQFAYPSIPGLSSVIYPITDPRDRTRSVSRQYYVYDGMDELSTYKLASVSFLKEPLDDYHFLETPDYSLDDQVYNDYGSMLLPRAVGYSAGLLKYFFRGQLQVTAIPLLYRNNLYTLNLTIVNETPDETMEQGEFALRYRYTPPGGPADGSGDIFGQGWGLDGAATIPCVRLESGESVEVSFLFLDSIPVETWSSLKLTLAFRGTLGREEGAVIGKVFSPGEIKFSEEWNNDLHGNHTWFHTGVDGPNPYPEFAIVSNQTPNNLLTKDLTFLVVEGGRQEGLGMVNSSSVGGTGQFQDIFPILVTPQTYLQFKIDDITLTRTPAPPDNWGADHFQGVLLHFSGGLSLLFSQGGYDPIVDHSKAALYAFTPGNTIWVDKIYRLFQDAGITIPPGPFYLWDIRFDQLLFYTYPDAEYHAHMVVDFIRIIEAAESESP